MMPDPDFEFLEFIRMLAVQIPEMVVLLLGMIFALMNWSTHPRPALLSFLGFALLLIVVIASEVFFFLVPVHLGQDWESETLELIAGGTRSFLRAGAYLLVIFAIFAGRKSRPPLPPYQ